MGVTPEAMTAAGPASEEIPVRDSSLAAPSPPRAGNPQTQWPRATSIHRVAGKKQVALQELEKEQSDRLEEK